jgi:hypothetical protein
MEQIALAVVGALASGVLAGGVGLFKWGMGLERRMTKIELKMEVDQ